MKHTYTLCAALLIAAQARADDAGLKYVPADALGFAHVRAAALWESPALADMREMIGLAGADALATLEKRFDPSPADLESLTGFLVMPREGAEPVPFVIVAFNKEVKKFDLGSADFGIRKLDDKTVLVTLAPYLKKLPEQPANVFERKA